MTTPARNALLRGVPKYVTTHVAYGDFTKLEAMTEAVRVLLDGTVPPEQVLAALVESGWRPTDDDLRAMGGRHRYYGDGMLTYVDLGWHFPSSEVQRNP